MLRTFAVSNYRSLRDLKFALAPLTIVTGANGSGKSNLYRALRLVAFAADGQFAEVLAMEGGIPSVQWAGPEDVRQQVRRGVPIQGGKRKGPLRIKFGFAADDYAYEIALGVPGGNSLFALDPEVKEEWIWQAPPRRKSNLWLERDHALVHARDFNGAWTRVPFSLPANRSVLSEMAEPERFPEIFNLREQMRRWRFYDGFRTDPESALRQPRIGVRTPVLAHDGRDLAAALQTIREIGNGQALDEAIGDAFPGSRLEILCDESARMQVALRTEGLLRPLAAGELSDGTLRYLCLLAALLSPRPPELMVLNEPESSLHPELLPPLARQIAEAAAHAQIWVITHSPILEAALSRAARQSPIQLVREYGETRIAGQDELDTPPWP
jgi:predicted ATPase